jgi:hypothetical protein
MAEASMLLLPVDELLPEDELRPLVEDEEPRDVEDEEELEVCRRAMPIPAPVTPEASAITRATAIAIGAIRVGLGGTAGG